MSATTGAAPPVAVLGLGLDINGRWLQKSRASAGSEKPPPAAGASGGTRTPLRLPSLGAAAKGACRRSGVARLSLSEPSLLGPNDNVLSEGFSSSRHPSVFQKRPPPPPPFSKSLVLLPCKTCPPPETGQPHRQQNHQQVQSCSRPAYIHFSQAIQPGSKPRPVRRHSHNPGLSAEMAQGDLRPVVIHYRNSSFRGEPLSVVGKPCLPSCSERPAVAAGPTRTQLHVFLPTEAEGEEVDSESVDEGFMDELDGKITSLKLQRGLPKTLKYR